jgi:ComF family protein
VTPSGSRSRTSRLAELTRELADGVVAVMLAPACAACRRPLDRPTRGAICPSCWDAIDPLTPLGSCSFPPLITLAAAIGPYDGTLKAIVQALKYEGRSTIARHLASRMRTAGTEILDGADLLVPVPLHGSRERQRGFNQACELAKHLGLPMREALVRTRNTATQADLPATQRQANVRGAFALSTGRVTIAGSVIVLVDDVSTTGATLNGCAAPLLEVGAREVRALTAARAEVRRR